MKRALISVSDKTGLIEFVSELVKLDYQIISTGGTKKVLDDANIATISIDSVTDFPEMLDGRVKTLHPLIHGGLLGVLDNCDHVAQMAKYDILPINLVCVNLYPFKETINKPNCSFENAIENIDIGGPSMLRSAAKNHKFVTVVTDINDYANVISEIKKNGDTTLITRSKLAAKVFRLTASYDAMIAQYLSDKCEVLNAEKTTLTFDLKQTLRYGENPHQNANFYTDGKQYAYSISSAIQLHGKELSYNNIQDANATLQILKEFKNNPSVVCVKHMNPCGAAIGSDIYDAWDKAYNADPMSIFGGIVALNQEVNAKIATEMANIFLEIILAPSFSKDAFEILSKKKNIRLMTFTLDGNDQVQKFVSVTGGILIQDEDDYKLCDNDLRCVTKKVMSDNQISDALFGQKIVKHVKSNAIVVVKDGVTVGIGAGQMNRVGAAKIALEQGGIKCVDATLASDAFFPMDDTVRLCATYKIASIIQPGGSIKDQDSINACDELDIAMVVSNKRHFKH